MASKLSNYSMGIGRPIIGRPETRFMRKFRWTIEFFWEDSSTLVSSVNSFLDRVGAGLEGVGAGINAAESIVGTVGSIATGNIGGAVGGAVASGASVIGAIGSINEAINPAEPVEFGINAHLCHVARRPSIQFEKTEIHFLHEKQYLAGLPTWDPLQLTLYDVQGHADVARWLYQVYQFGKHGSSGPMSETQYYKARGFLIMWDGEGVPLQSWILHGCWPEHVDWGDLDMSSSDTADVELTVSIDSADLIYERKSARRGNNTTYNPGVKFDTRSTTAAADSVKPPDQGEDDSILQLIIAGAGLGLAGAGELFSGLGINPSAGRDANGRPITQPTIANPPSNLPNIT